MARTDIFTEEHQQEFRDRWTDKFWQTGPCDRPKMEAAVDEAYRSAGLPLPRVKIWLDSPMAGMLAAHLLSSSAKAIAGNPARKQIVQDVRTKLLIQVGDYFDNQVPWAPTWHDNRDPRVSRPMRLARTLLRGYIVTSFGSALLSPAEAEFRQGVREQLVKQIEEQVAESDAHRLANRTLDFGFVLAPGMDVDSIAATLAQSSSGGHHDADFIGLHLYLGELCGLEDVVALQGLGLLSECGWWWPFQNAVILTDRPIRSLRDDRDRFHCNDGPAIEYADSWKVHAVHGVRVPEKVIMRPITLSQIENEPNAETRRVMIERYGAARYLFDSKAEVVSHDATGILYCKRVPDDAPIVMVRVLNSTQDPNGSLSRDEAIAIFGPAAKYAEAAPTESRWKEYMLRVPPRMGSYATAHEAVAWTFGIDIEEEYAPILES